MNYTANKFEADLKSVAYNSDPKQAVKLIAKIFEPKIEKLIENKYKFNFGVPYTQVKNGKIFVQYPVINTVVSDTEDFWNTVEKPISSDVIDLLDDPKINEFWEYEGIQPSRKQGKNGEEAIDIILVLK